MPFPTQLADRIAALTGRLDAFGAVTEFRYLISDLDPALAAQPGFDDGGWTAYTGKPPFRRDQGVTWVRARYTVPASCLDIPLAESRLRICPNAGYPQPYFSPISIYADGRLLLSETAWMDCKCPEAILSESAVPGTTHTIAVRFDFGEKSFWEPALPMVVISDAVEERALHLGSIVEELRYLEGIPEAAAVLPECCALLERAASEDGTGALMRAAQECRRLCEPLRDAVKKHRVSVITHAHIDMNWFWPMEETERIIDRDFTTMTGIMEADGDFTFSQSQCATYAIEERNNPDVFAKMQRFADKGQWDITASTWVEGDLNMASGESIARHVLYSKKYLAEKFRQEPKIMWCPDTFGHPATIPQILKQSGLDYYFFTRCGIGVNDSPCNDFDYLRDAHHPPLFWWTGQDGSRVLCCNLVYGREFSSRGVLRVSAAMRDRYGYDKAMYVFGVGDHGGGPTLRDIAWMRTISRFPTVPTLQFSTTAAFYDQVAADNPPGLPERSGEMNFVFDGCYTTHADIKYYNRRCENDLEAAESLCATASLTGYRYPAEEFERLWRAALFNQFHDILDGSGVQDAYRYSREQGEMVLARLRELESEALAHLAGGMAADGGGRSVLLYNPAFSPRDGCVTVPVCDSCTVWDADGKQYPSQPGGGALRIHVRDLPPMGYRVLHLREEQPVDFAPSVADDGEYYRMTTDHYDLEIHKSSGRITTLYDRAARRFVVRREAIGWRLKNGCLNTLQIHCEEPTEMSSWTIGDVRTVRSLLDGAESHVAEDGPVCARLRFVHRFDGSVIAQDIVVYRHSPRIDFETQVDWREYGDFDRDAPMLKVCFSPDVKNTHAAYEIPFGAIERLTGDYECPALRWADIGDGAYGFALLNDSKHGYKCRGNTLELTLIRSGWLPDQRSDYGEHRFTYSILPHTGDWREGEVFRQAAFLGHPVRSAVVRGRIRQDRPFSLIALDDPRIPVCGVKRSEDGEDLIVRVYNPTEGAVSATAHLGFPAERVLECDLLERSGEEVPHGGDFFQVKLGPKKVKSYRIRFR